MKKKVIVTGAAGFAGFSAVSHLLWHGYEVYAIVRPKSNNNKRLDSDNILRMIEKDIKKGSIIPNERIIEIGDIRRNLHVIQMEMSEYCRLPEVIKEKCDAFLHFAWRGGRDEFYVQTENIKYTIEALEAAKVLGCSRFIVSGTQAECGIHNELIDEDILPRPIGSYGAAKMAAFYMAKNRAEQLGIDFIWARIFSLYGLYEKSGRLITELISSLEKGEEMKLSSCTQIWDYLDVGDAAEAFISLIERGRPGEIYNVANGNERQLKAFVEDIRKIMGGDTPVTYGNPPEPYMSLQPVTAKIKRHTGWEPRVPFMGKYSLQDYLEHN